MKKIFGRHKKQEEPIVAAVQTAEQNTLPVQWRECACACTGERRLYDALRENVPVIDAGIDKIIRLIGTFKVVCEDERVQRDLQKFLQNVQVNAAERGIQCFLNSYLSQLLTYGNAVGEIVLSHSAGIGALYNASLEDLELREASPLKVEILRREQGKNVPVQYPELVLLSALNPPPGSSKGVSLLHGLSFVSGILLQIYQSIGMNWERAGNVRFAVTYQPTSDASDRAFAKERAQQIASEWGRAMQKGSVNDFVAVGNVNIKAIGADNQILDSNVPARQMMEQIVAKLGLPPFLLGLSWSSTERMSSQQADILTSELESYRCLLNPVVFKICSLWLQLNGYEAEVEIQWDDITLQDEVDLANARLIKAQAAKLEAELKKEED